VIELTCRYFDAKGIRYERFVANFSNPEEAEALGRRVLEKTGPIDLLVNVAGITVPTDITQVTVAEYRRLHDVNWTSAVMLTKTL